MIIAVAGSGSKAGKTTFCKTFMRLLKRNQRWEYLSTSDCLIRKLSTEIGVSEYDIKADKENYRPQLIALSKDDPTMPLLSTLEQWDVRKNLIFESMRRPEDYKILREMDTMFVYVMASRKVRDQRGAGNNDLPTKPLHDVLFPLGEPVKDLYVVNNEYSIQALETRTLQIISIASKKIAST